MWIWVCIKVYLLRIKLQMDVYLHVFQSNQDSPMTFKIMEYSWTNEVV